MGLLKNETSGPPHPGKVQASEVTTILPPATETRSVVSNRLGMTHRALGLAAPCCGQCPLNVQLSNVLSSGTHVGEGAITTLKRMNTATVQRASLGTRFPAGSPQGNCLSVGGPTRGCSFLDGH